MTKGLYVDFELKFKPLSDMCRMTQFGIQNTFL